MTIRKTYTSTTDGAALDTCPTDTNTRAEVSLPTPLSAPVHPNCEVMAMPDQSVIITLRVDAATIKRHRSRANGMDLSRYMWENILHRALVDSVY